MSRDGRGFDLIVTLILLALALGGASLLADWSCSKRWAASGMKSRWEFGAGCLVQRKDGSWVPDRSVREVQL